MQCNLTTERKSRKNNPLYESREKLQKIVEKHFPNKYSILETCLSVKAQGLIEGITLPFFLILLGEPASGKSTLLDIVGSLEDCYRSDSFTPKAFVSHAANIEKSKLESIDLLPRIKNKTFITPELAPLFSSKDDNLLEIIGILTRILDGKGYQKDSGVHGQRGYSGNFFFTWLGAVVEIPKRVWSIMGNLGPKMYFLRLPQDLSSEEEKQQKILSNMKDKTYDLKVDEVKHQVQKILERTKRIFKIFKRKDCLGNF